MRLLIRVYTQLDTRLMFEDLFAKLAQYAAAPAAAAPAPAAAAPHS